MPDPIRPSFSPRVAQSVLKDRGLDTSVHTEALAEAAAKHDTDAKGYASRDELELAASDLQKQLGGLHDESRDGLTFSRKFFDQAKAELKEQGVRVTDAELFAAARGLDNGNGRLSKAELFRAVRLVKEMAFLEDVQGKDVGLARPVARAQAADATDDLSRRKLSERFQHAGGPVKVAFFDADSTLRVSRSGKVSANDPRDVALLPFVGERIQKLVEEGYLIAVVSNQQGVQYGHVTMETADEALQYTADLIRAAGGDVHYVDFAEGNGPDRKPGSGMYDRLNALLAAEYGAGISVADSFMCGDSAYKQGVDTRPDGTAGTSFSNSDRRFAEEVGIRFEEPSDTFGWRDHGVAQIDDVTQLQDWTRRFTVGRDAAGGPLAVRMGLLTKGD